MLRVVLGLIKGGLVGAGVGFAASKLGIVAGGAAFAAYALVGFLVGLVCGRAIWRQETLWTPALKGLVGAAICAGLYWGASKVLGGVKLPFTAALGAPDQPLAHIPLLLAPAIGILYGIFVEVDDGERKGAGAAKPAA